MRQGIEEETTDRAGLGTSSTLGHLHPRLHQVEGLQNTVSVSIFTSMSRHLDKASGPHACQPSEGELDDIGDGGRLSHGSGKDQVETRMMTRSGQGAEDLTF